MSRTVDVDMGHGHGHAPARPAADRPRWLAGLDTFLGFLIEIPAAILVLTEIVVPLAGVIGWRCWARWWPSAGPSTCA